MNQEMEKCLARLTEFISVPEYQDEIERAKQGFFKQIGEPQNGEPLLEMRLATFFEWFIFDRRLDGTRTTPVELYIEKQGLSLTEIEKEVLQGFTRTVHSIFKVMKKEPACLLKDLFTNTKIKNVNHLASSLSKDDVTEARLVPIRDKFYMTEAICFHPHQAHKFLLKEIKRARKNGDNLDLLLRRFMFMSTKWERYPRMKVEQIYK